MADNLLYLLPSTLGPLLQIDLLILENTRKKNAAQHRTGLFFRRVHEVYRLGKEVYAELQWINARTVAQRESRKAEIKRLQNEGIEVDALSLESHVDKECVKHTKRLTNLVLRAFSALNKASASVEKMIHHLHFLPLTTLLLAIYARIWLLCINIYAHVCTSGLEENISGAELKPFVNFGTLDVVSCASAHTALALRLPRAKSELQARGEGMVKAGKGKERSNIQPNSAPEDNQGETEADFGVRIERHEDTVKLTPQPIPPKSYGNERAKAPLSPVPVQPDRIGSDAALKKAKTESMARKTKSGRDTAADRLGAATKVATKVEQSVGANLSSATPPPVGVSFTQAAGVIKMRLKEKEQVAKPKGKTKKSKVDNLDDIFGF